MIHRDQIRKRIILPIILAATLLILTVEIVGRHLFGLGDPPLATSDPNVEYLPVASRTFHRFGNTIHINAYHMRAPEFPPSRTGVNEYRILLIGDSIIYGGNRLDQSQIIGEQLTTKLAQRINRPVIVGSAAASSWGPRNMLAYLERFGVFDAQVAILTLSAHNLNERPYLQDDTGPYPKTTPWSVTHEILRYVWQHLLYADQRSAPASTKSLKAIDCVRMIVVFLRDHGVEPVILIHPARDGLSPYPSGNLAVIDDLARSMKVNTIYLADVFRSAINSNEDPYIDGIHPSVSGAALIASRLSDYLAAR
jgi:GDSL-like Lipase/Acylhydrolase family